MREEKHCKLKFIHSALRFCNGNLQAIETHGAAHTALVKSVCVEILLEFYYHFDTHKNPSTVLLLIRFAARQVACDVGALLTARRWRKTLASHSNMVVEANKGVEAYFIKLE